MFVKAQQNWVKNKQGNIHLYAVHSVSLQTWYVQRQLTHHAVVICLAAPQLVYCACSSQLCGKR
eukprot:14064-Heterococcus_DN1.PRE.4